jgi:LysR family glycine cleavage system transcriptional activator
MPPLNTLRVFEAAARHESFAKAAEELGVTPAAVSHQIKTLEEWLGATLFVRHAQGLYLTDPGRAAIPALAAAFDALGSAVQELRVAVPGAKINIAALPSVAQLWLAPRLPSLRVAFPNMRPSLYAVEEPPDFRREPFDLGIFFTRGTPRRAQSFKICDDLIFPVCTPAIAATLHSPSDLGSHPLLWDTSWINDWACWLSAAHVTSIVPNQGPAFSLYSLAVEAALDGAGVLMAHQALIVGPLTAGKLVVPFAERAETGASLTILVPDQSSARLAPVIEWLTASHKSQGSAAKTRSTKRKGSR